MTKITQGFILAAGRGTRMRHLTDDKPKPLVEVNGKSLIDYNIRRLKNAGITNCMINLCYKGALIKEHLASNTELNFQFSEEQEALETGGGIKNALSQMKNAPFVVLNSDALWTEAPNTELIKDMCAAWDEKRFDMLMMFVPLKHAFQHIENGDYNISPEGFPKRRLSPNEKADYLYGGVLITHPKVFDSEPEGRYSLVRIFDKLEKEKRLGVYIHKGGWFHVGTPESVLEAEAYFKLHPLF